MVMYSTGFACSYGEPVAKLGRYQGNSTEYQTVVSWTVPQGKAGSLREVSMITSDFEHTRFRLTIAGKVQFEERALQTTLTLPFFDNRLEAGSKVVVEARSTDGSVVTVDGSITGREF